MPLKPAQGKTTRILLVAFLLVILSAVYLRAESGASSVVTMAGEKSIASYKAEVEAKELAMEKAKELDREELAASTTETLE